MVIGRMSEIKLTDNVVDVIEKINNQEKQIKALSNRLRKLEQKLSYTASMSACFASENSQSSERKIGLSEAVTNIIECAVFKENSRDGISAADVEQALYTVLDIVHRDYVKVRN